MSKIIDGAVNMEIISRVKNTMFLRDWKLNITLNVYKIATFIYVMWGFCNLIGSLLPTTITFPACREKQTIWRQFSKNLKTRTSTSHNPVWKTLLFAKQTTKNEAINLYVYALGTTIFLLGVTRQLLWRRCGRHRDFCVGGFVGRLLFFGRGFTCVTMLH